MTRVVYPEIAGALDPFAGYIAIDTYANIVSSYPAASYSGCTAKASDIDGVIYSNGTRWLPLNGECVLRSSGVPYGIAPTGTINAGSSANITLGTALHTTYSDGIWLYLPSKATTPAITAGFYWVVMSSTTSGTVYSNGPGSAAINFTAGTGAYTGVTSDVTLASITIPAGLLGTAGSIFTYVLVATSSNANSKTVYQRLAGSSLGSLGFASQGFGQNFCSFYNSNTASKQIGGFGAAIASPSVTTVDTTAAQTYTIVAQMATATDYMILTGSQTIARVKS